MGDDSPPRERIRTDFGETYKVIVGTGTNRQSFIVHREKIRRVSKFFGTVRGERWTADIGVGPAKPIELPDTDPEVFDRYLHCLSTSRVQEVLGRTDEDGFVRARVDLYLLADKLQDISAANLIMDELIAYATEVALVPDLCTVAHVYHSSAPGNPFRKLMRDWMAHDGCPEPGHDPESAPPGLVEALLDIYIEFSTLKISNALGKVSKVFCQYVEDRDKCHYHQHDKDHPACGS